MVVSMFLDSNFRCFKINKSNFRDYVNKYDSLIVSFKIYEEIEELLLSTFAKVYIISNSKIHKPLPQNVYQLTKYSQLRNIKDNCICIGGTNFVRKIIEQAEELIITRIKNITVNKFKPNSSILLDRNNQYELISLSENKKKEERIYIKH